MPHSRLVFRSVVAAALVAAVIGASGCRWFRGGSDLYAQSPETRPLEVPPDLDRPDTSGAMKLPETGGSVTRSSMPAPAARGAAASATGFTVPGNRDEIFAKLGDALATTPGVTIASRAQVLGTYDVDYEGSKFLLRATSVEAGTYVSAVDPRGLPASGEAPVKLIAALRTALGN